MGSGSPRWTTSLAEPRASGAVLWDVGTVRWLRPVDPERRVWRAGRHDEQRLNDERHGALIPERADVLHRQEEAGAGGILVSDAAAVGGTGVVQRPLALGDRDERRAWARVPSAGAARSDRHLLKGGVARLRRRAHDLRRDRHAPPEGATPHLEPQLARPRGARRPG